MRARKIRPKIGYLYHYTLKSNVKSILKDKAIKSRDDYVFFTGSLADSVKAFNNEIMSEGRPYFDLDGVLRYREKCDRKDYCILKIPYRDDNCFYKFDVDDQPEDSIYRLAIAHKGTYDFKKARVLEMTSRKVARKEAVNRKNSDVRTVCGIDGRRLRKIAAAALLTGVLLSPQSAFANSLLEDVALGSLRSGSMSQIMQTEGERIANLSRGERRYVPDGSHKVLINPGEQAEIDDSFEYYEDYHIDAHGAEGLTASGKVNGSVSAVHEPRGPDNIFGVSARAKTKGIAYVDVSENVSIVGEGQIPALGINATAVKESDYAEVKVGGDVTALSPESVALGIDTSDGNVTVGGNVSASGGEYVFGVMAMSKNQASRIMIKGGLSAEGLGVQGAAISAEDETGDLTFSVGNGGISAISKGDIDVQGMPESMPLSTGLLVTDGSGKLSADIQGDINVQSDKKRSTAVMVGMTHSEDHGDPSLPKGIQFVRVRGNIISDEKGIMFIETDYSVPSVTDVLVENEIQADKVAILVYKHHAELLLPENDKNRVTSLHKLNLTAWKIKVNESGNVAEYYTEDVGKLPDGVSPSGVDRDFEKKINYIVKAEKPAVGSIKVLDAGGKALAKSHGYDVAREGEKILLKADKGYQITAAYNGKGKKTALSKDKNGNFYLVVPKGGGVYLSAEVKKEAAPTPKPTPKPTSTQAKVSGTLIAKAVASGNTTMNISWTKVKGAAGYDIYFAKCGTPIKKIKNVKAGKALKCTQKGLKKKASYRTYVKAYVIKNGKKTYVRTSPTMHAYTGGASTYTNAKSVSVKKTSVALKKGKTFKIKALVQKVNSKKKLMADSHAPKLRYLTSNNKVATVDKSGKIKAGSKGSCVIYVYAHNGVFKSIKVTVK